MLSLQQLRERLANGFRPFALRLTDGRRFDVPHRDFIALGKGVVVVIVVVIDQQDISHLIDPLHIVSLEERLNTN
jgi:hypothetical protein